MRDIVLYLHIILGGAVAVLAVQILIGIKNKAKNLKLLALLACIGSWIMIIPSAILYLVFYPATKTLVKAGSWSWAHSIIMETKEHWGILIPIVASVGALSIYSGKESKKWWYLLLTMVVLVALMGRIIKIGALQ